MFMHDKVAESGPKTCIIAWMKNLNTLLALLGLWLCMTHATAAAKEYDFELIIFEDRSGRYANSEQWQHELLQSGTSTSAAEAAGSSSDTGTFSSDAESKIREIKGIGLAKYARKLKSNKRYNVLVHKAWRQPGLSRKDAIDIAIDSRPTGTSTAPTAKTGNSIHGSVKIVLARYLHIYTDMIYRQPRPDTTPAWNGAETQQYKEFPINFHRRMRSKELHYLDHPMVGILVMAMPVKNKETTEEES